MAKKKKGKPKTKPERQERIDKAIGRKGNNLNATPLLSPNEVVFWKKRTFTPRELNSGVLRVDDELYQRHEIKPWVNELIRVLENGGVINDPIVVAVRPDGSMWIVDGQQRYWAHWNCGKPLQAMLYRVASLDAEKKLFLQYNCRRAVGAVHRVKAWPGEAGELIRWVGENTKSALFQEITYETNGRIPASTVAKSICCLLTGTVNPSRIDLTMARLEHEIHSNKARVYKSTEMFCVLMVQVFGRDKVRSLPPRALAVAAYQHWQGLKVKDAWPMPTKGQFYRLRNLKWEKLALDQQHRWLLIVRDEILRIWKKGKGADARKRPTP